MVIKFHSASGGNGFWGVFLGTALVDAAARWPPLLDAAAVFSEAPLLIAAKNADQVMIYNCLIVCIVCFVGVCCFVIFLEFSFFDL